jgi:16S rRNA C967 or C1407 C5-methylase (RsmB/RsmF family)/NOL1/NOP2/fmu family ribosome biogenesis protein
MELPIAFQDRMLAQLGKDFPAFIEALEENAPVSIHLHQKKRNTEYEDSQKVPWHPELGRYLPERPVFTLDPSFHAGTYYVQEASSMFLAHIFKSVFKNGLPKRVLDMCAAPGGKSTLIASLLDSDALLLSNEVIQSRFQILNQNLTKWGLPNTQSSNHDPENFKGLEGFFDFIVVDAPCSGEGLFRKDENASDEWSEENVNICAGRQKRILAATIPLLAENGILVYSTCTYNDQENQKNCKWIKSEFGLEEVPIPIDGLDGIEAKENGFQFYPHKVKGEGFFCAVFKQKSEVVSNLSLPKKPTFKNLIPLPKAQVETMADWVENADEFEFFMTKNETIKAIPKTFLPDLLLIDSILKKKNFGLDVGTFKGNNFIPDHALALSIIKNKTLPKVELNLDEALIFLKKEIPNKNWEGKGWHLATYKNESIGWLKLIPGRANNYLPTNWRIKMHLNRD